jgi:hypothetical protein
MKLQRENLVLRRAIQRVSSPAAGSAQLELALVHGSIKPNSQQKRNMLQGNVHVTRTPQISATRQAARCKGLATGLVDLLEHGQEVLHPTWTIRPGLQLIGIICSMCCDTVCLNAL